MAVKYLEVTIQYVEGEDTCQVSHREKVDEDDWSEVSVNEVCAPDFQLGHSIADVKLELHIPEE